MLRSSNRGRRLAAELLTLAAGLVGGVLLVTLLVYAPRAFLGTYGRASGLGPYLHDVGAYLGALLQGDLAGGARGGRVSQELLKAARRSLELLGVSLAVVVPLGLGWGALLAAARPRPVAAALFGLNALALALPSFVLLVLLLEAAVSLGRQHGVRLLATNGYGLDFAHLALPVTALALRGAAVLARAAHVAHDEALRQDWVRVARAKGLGGVALWRRHVLPALRGTLLAAGLGALRAMVGGLVIVEWVANWNGLGERMLAVGRLGSARPADEPIAAGAGVLFVLLFVTVDGLARLAARRAGGQEVSA
jgi:ABC-type dipeptide/oligopeptide/nickel transport system permease component